MIYLEQVTPLAQTLIDSAQLDETGNYKLELCDVDRTPALYNLVCNGDKIPLFLQGGDRLTVSSVRTCGCTTIRSKGLRSRSCCADFISRLWPGCSGSMR
ncbi:MAG: hypothetical protein ACLVJK_07675 [Alistipes putredinis]